MKTLQISVFLFLAAIGISQAQNKEERQVADFEEINVSGNFEVYITQANVESLSLEGDADILKEVRTEVSGGRLKIWKDKPMKNGWNWTKEDNKTVKVYLSYKTIKALSASASAGITSNSTIKTEKLTLSASSAADLDVSVDTEALVCDASSGADINVKGKTLSFEVEASSGADIDADLVEAQDVKADASSGADISVYAQKSIDADASSGADISYKGNPEKVKVRSSSGGDVNSRKGN